MFESAWIDSLRSKFPVVGKLPLSDVIAWFGRLALGKRQIAESGPVKALFCLLHLARDWNFEPTALLWISHGLEALYSVPNALSFNFLRDRISLLFDAPSASKAQVARELRELYDLRNAFVHGGMNIARPFANEVVDRRLNNFNTRLLDSRDFGARLLLASLQEMIRRQLTQLNFRESLCGDAG